MHRGAELLDSNLDEAERCYRRAIEIDPTLRGAWFDLGLIHKWRKEWDRCLECNKTAAALLTTQEAHHAAEYWNAGIAATAIEDWPSARWAWRNFGIPIPIDDGDGPIEMNFGLGVVRLPVGETVWGRRIDPARMILLSIPLPESGFRAGDIVLHDGEPKGRRAIDGNEYPVFDIIARWRESPDPTIEVVVDADASQIAALLAALETNHVPHENWTESIHPLCAACSHGRVDYDHPDHNHEADLPGTAVTIGCSGELDRIVTIVERWNQTTHGTILHINQIASQIDG